MVIMALLLTLYRWGLLWGRSQYQAVHGLDCLILVFPLVLQQVSLWLRLITADAEPVSQQMAFLLS